MPSDGSGGDLVLAVDGGNAKTDVALLDATGGLLSLVRGGGSSAHHLGVEGAIAVLEDLLGKAVARAGIDPSARPLAARAYLLLAGADLPEERATLQSAVEQLKWSARLVVDNDTLALLRAGTDRGWGVAVVSGAGINCLGRAPDGTEIRFLSLGEISGDWGGGVDMGLAALAAAARSADGRGPHTTLQTGVAEHFGLAGPLELSRALHLRQIPAARLGELAPVILSASEEDPVAAGIVSREADEVIAFADAALRRLELTQTDPDVVLGGGVLRAVPSGVVETIARGVRALAPDAHVLVSPSEPIVGAALLGLDALAAPESAARKARAQLDAAVQRVEPEEPVTADRAPSAPRPLPLPRPVAH
jgi:N-acetylglucosamine kinase-like BadF-type ATPase